MQISRKSFNYFIILNFQKSCKKKKKIELSYAFFLVV